MKIIQRNLALLLFLTLTLGCAHNVDRGDSPEVMVYIVRHAERADDGAMTGSEDPPLSHAGRERAALLAETLRDAGITTVHSTDYQRTRETVGPLSTQTGVGIEIYDARDMSAFATLLRSTPGRHLVVGHSNTTPQLVEALGGDPSGTIDSMEYDRLYLVMVEGGRVRTVLLRFGERFGG